MESKKEIKYKHSEGNKTNPNKISSNKNIKSEDDILFQLEQLKSENK